MDDGEDGKCVQDGGEFNANVDEWKTNVTGDHDG